ncbi:MAG TPA: pyruvate kinase, partial [Paraburkholderia sp.]
MNTREKTASEVSWETRLAQVKDGVEELRFAALAAEHEFSAASELAAPSMRASTVNLVHYLAVRRHDVRALQDDLARLGLSSLGRMESRVMASLQAVLRVLYTLLAEPVPTDVIEDPSITFDSGPALLDEHTNAILGAAPQGRRTRIMVTMPGEAAGDPDLIRRLVEAGMGIMRINCAHDSPATWEQMVKHLRHAERELGQRCLISFDLAGPKLRTGPIAPGPAVVKLRPGRDALGHVTRLARVRLTIEDGTQSDSEVLAIPVEASLLGKAKPGDTVAFVDARGRKRVLSVTEVRPGECMCETDRPAYVIPGLR